MGIVLQDDMLRKFYEEATQDIENKSSSFWQAFLRQSFERDIYLVLYKFPAEESHETVNMVIQHYNITDNTLLPVLLVKFSRGSEEIDHAEKLALDEALGYIAEKHLQSVYVLTTAGVSFRAWVVDRQMKELQPFEESMASGNRVGYIDVDSNDAEALVQFVEKIKTHPPLREVASNPNQRQA